MKRWICLLLALLLCASVFAGCSCSHEYAPATCTAPATCILCQQTQGQPLGHTWQEATCETPKNCSVCNATEGQALGHSWKDADCLTAQTCTICGASHGEALGHVEDMAALTAIDFVNATCEGTISCVNCGIELSSGSQPLPKLHDGSRFLCTPEQFYQRLCAIVRAHTSMDAFMTTGTSDVYICRIQTVPGTSDGEDFSSSLIFRNGDRILTAQDSNLEFTCLEVALGENKSFLEALFGNMTIPTIAAVLMACDPTMPDMLDPQIESALWDTGTYTAKGLTYKLDANDDNTLTLTIQIGS